jgi:hypothetical protein
MVGLPARALALRSKYSHHSPTLPTSATENAAISAADITRLAPARSSSISRTAIRSGSSQLVTQVV